MKVFTNDTDTVICESINDVESVIKEVCGYSFEDEGMSIDDWSEIPADELITICNLNDGGPDDKETRTAAEWASKEGRGFLCSTEW
jgi:hypothetical protein